AHMGDSAEARTMLDGGAPIHSLAVYNDERLPGTMSNIPTAAEQAFDMNWPIIPGFYVGPTVSDEQYRWWVESCDKSMATPEFAKLQEQQGLFHFNKPGDELDAYVKERVAFYTELADSFGLIKK